MKRKRILSLVLAVLLLCTALIFPTCAEEPDGVNASNYLYYYNAGLSPSATSGKLVLSYYVYATGVMSSVGVFKIIVRKSNGTIYKTIWGSTANGLIKSNSASHSGTYTFSAVSGTSYYCTVVVFAQNASGSDSRTLTTATVTCP